MIFDGIVQDLIDEFAKLPGIGPRGASRIVFHIVEHPEVDVSRLSELLREVRERVRYCQECGNVGETDLCRICSDPGRSRAAICVVESPKDISAIERTREFRGVYHVLGGALNPLNGIGPEQLRIAELLRRLADPQVAEVIIATDPNVEGEATGAYLARQLAHFDVRVSRLASGLPVGGDLEYADEVTLGRAFEGRRAVHEPQRGPAGDAARQG